MAVAIDMTGMTAGEMADLGAALGCTTMRQVQVKLLAAQAMGEADGDMPLDMLVPMMWIARRASDPAFTLEMAREMPFSELLEGFAVPNAGGGEPAEPSSPTSSVRSVRSTATRRASSGRSK
jgi:hypothetical protein